MMTTTARTITLSDAAPVKIDDSKWPIIAEGRDYPGEHFFQAFDLVWIKVRRHADGRTLVYGGAGDASHGGRPEREDRRAGYLLPDPTETVATIRVVAVELSETDHCAELAATAGRRCIADMPADTID
jgi:hypothetical protein